MSVTRRDFVRQLFGLLALPVIGKAGGAPAPRPPCRFRLERFCIAGFRYYEGPGLVTRLRSGDPLTLRAEPDNPHDPRAVAVYFGRHKLGYVPRRKNAVLSRLLAQGAAVGGRVLAARPEAEPWEMVEAEATLETAPALVSAPAGPGKPAA
ncbi:MAG: HIRAN domain-containing protein [Anaerolineae bacterium]|nr:HIRAN domain-containing protein [Anaerolineae bacterium]